jgi:hypothetical protein
MLVLSVPVRGTVGVARQDGVMRVSARADAVFMMGARARGTLWAGSRDGVMRDRSAAELPLDNNDRGGQRPRRRRERESRP